MNLRTKESNSENILKPSVVEYIQILIIPKEKKRTSTGLYVHNTNNKVDEKKRQLSANKQTNRVDKKVGQLPADRQTTRFDEKIGQLRADIQTTRGNEKI